MHEGPDVLGSEREPRAPLPRWLRLVAACAVMVAAVGWLAVPHLRHRPPATPAPVQHSTDPAPVSDPDHCGRAGPDGLAWAAPQVSGVSSRVAVVRVLACNTGRRAATVLSLGSVDPGRTALRSEDLTTLTGAPALFGPEVMLPPATIPAGGRATLASASALLTCADAPATLSALRAVIRADRGDTHTDVVSTAYGDSGSVSGWCADPPAIPLERVGPLDVRVDRSRRTLFVRIGLLNPNAEPVQLTGVGSPSGGVRVIADNLHGQTLPAGGTLTVTARYLVEQCDQVFIDGPWSLLPIAAGPLPAAPIQLSSRPWQQAALGILCPGRHPLRGAHGPAVLQVTPGGGGSGSGAGGKSQLDLSMSVRNAGRAPVLLTLRKAPVPGAVLRSVSAVPGVNPEGPKQPLTQFRLPVGASATVTLSYDVASNQGDCAFAGVAGWPAPVAVVDLAGHPVPTALTAELLEGGRGWLGSWLLSNPFGCFAQPLHRGIAPPFLVREDAVPLIGNRLQLTLLGLRGLPTATVLAIRSVGLSADLVLVAAGLPREVPPGRAVSVPLTPQVCPAGTTSVRIAVDYRVAGRTGVPPPLVIDLAVCTSRS